MTELAHQQSLLPPWTLLEALDQQDIKTLCLLAFAAEGNNAPDAMHIADALNQYVKLVEPQGSTSVPSNSNITTDSLSSLHVPWLAPMSWKYVYGTASKGIY